MCGIAGFIDGKLSGDESQSLIVRMLDSIAHRGPDARGIWSERPITLGHNRLSIIDLSPEGNQPMEYFDSVITYNGEIYNYIEVRDELKKRGYIFKTQSDTEVILAAYREYGENCVEHFVGMWAFALWDKKEQILFCSRDRFGIKPFYYIHDGNRFYFGSEYKPLKLSPLFSNELNLAQVSRGLQLGWVTYHDETYFQKIKQLPAAHNLKLAIGNGQLAIKKYWDIDLTKKFSGTFEEKKEKFYQLFSDSVKLHMRSDVEVAICLSGGIDSSCLTAMVSSTYSDLQYKTFSIYYDGKNEVDEREYINSVLQKYPKVEPDFYKPKIDSVIQYFDEIIDKTEVPATGSSNFSHYFLVKRIHEQGIKVVLDGQGADEYLAGYMHSYYRYFADMLKTFSLGKFLSDNKKLAVQQHLSSKDYLSNMGKSILSLLCDEQKLYQFEFSNYYPFLSDDNSQNINLKKLNANKLSNFLYHLVFNASLPTILHYVDRMTMSHSLESRVPFLDHRMVEFGFSLGNENKIHNVTTKYILRESLKELLPEKVYARSDKKGFVTPGEVNWLRNDLKHLLEINFNKMEFINRKVARNVIEDYIKGNNRNSKLVWRLATLNYWINKLN